MRSVSTTSPMQKTCRILRAISDTRTRTLTHIAAATGIDKASALRILQVLIDEGLVVRNERTKEYSYGRESFVLSVSLKMQAMAHVEDNLARIARPGLERLAETTGDAISLLIRSGTEAVCIGRYYGDFPIRVHALDIGGRRPLGAGAGSLAMLAWADEQEQDSILKQIEPRLTTEYPLLTVKLMRREMAQTRKVGYAKLLNVIVNHMGGLGLPIRGPDNEIVGAVSISAITPRIVEREAQLVKQIYKEVTVIERSLRELAQPA